MLKIYYPRLGVGHIVRRFFYIHGIVRCYALTARQLPPLKYSTIAFLIAFSAIDSVHALSTDSEQDIEIEADTAELDRLKNTTVFRGNVVVTQGSIRITGDTMTIVFDGQNRVDSVITLGQPATYRQLPENSTIYDEAEALRMEYYARKNQLLMFNQVRLVQQENIYFNGKYIEYDTVKGQAMAKDINQIATIKEPEQTTDKGRRIQVIIKNLKPKQKQQKPKDNNASDDE